MPLRLFFSVVRRAASRGHLHAIVIHKRHPPSTTTRRIPTTIMDSSPFSQNLNQNHPRIAEDPFVNSSSVQGQRAPANRTLFANQRVVGSSVLARETHVTDGIRQNNVRQAAADLSHDFLAPSSPAGSQQHRATTVYPVGVKAGLPSK